MLPANVKLKEAKINTQPDMWLYGDSYSGKTMFCDSLDDILFLNTDGNIDHILSPYIRIQDTIVKKTMEVQGKSLVSTSKVLAWENFLRILNELEKKDNTYKVICVDLLEDLYEHCRIYMLNKLNIEHEADASFGKGWDLVRFEFVKNIKRLKNMGYQIILISKTSSKEIIDKNKTRCFSIAPNINEKIANIISGTVDLTARITIDPKSNARYLNFDYEKFDNNGQTITFGGTRYNFKQKQVPLNKNEFIKALENSQKGVV